RRRPRRNVLLLLAEVPGLVSCEPDSRERLDRHDHLRPQSPPRHPPRRWRPELPWWHLHVRQALQHRGARRALLPHRLRQSQRHLRPPEDRPRAHPRRLRLHRTQAPARRAERELERSSIVWTVGTFARPNGRAGEGSFATALV